MIHVSANIISTCLTSKFIPKRWIGIVLQNLAIVLFARGIPRFLAAFSALFVILVKLSTEAASLYLPCGARPFAHVAITSPACSLTAD